MIDVHYWPTPKGWKVTIFLEEAGLKCSGYAVGNELRRSPRRWDGPDRNSVDKAAATSR